MVSQERRRIFSLLVCFGLMAFSSMVSASSVRQLDVDEMLVIAELVFEGDVIESKASWNTEHTLIKTHITFNVNEVISGEYSQNTLTLSFVGGTIGADKIQAQGLRQPRKGESGIYFIESLSKELVNPLVGWSQGQFLTSNNNGGTKRMMTDRKRPIMSISANQEKRSLKHSAQINGLMATGVEVSNKLTDSGMTVDSFKSELKKRMKNLRSLKKSN